MEVVVGREVRVAPAGGALVGGAEEVELELRCELRPDPALREPRRLHLENAPGRLLHHFPAHVEGIGEGEECRRLGGEPEGRVRAGLEQAVAKAGVIAGNREIGIGNVVDAGDEVEVRHRQPAFPHRRPPLDRDPLADEAAEVIGHAHRDRLDAGRQRLAHRESSPPSTVWALPVT